MDPTSPTGIHVKSLKINPLTQIHKLIHLAAMLGNHTPKWLDKLYIPNLFLNCVLKEFLLKLTVPTFVLYRLQ